jgi:hypothetical protein
MKYINVSFDDGAIVWKSEERNCKRDSPKGEGKLWEPDLSLGRKKNMYTNEKGMPHARVMKPKCGTVTEDI